jgi:hypothetical protein
MPLHAFLLLLLPLSSFSQALSNIPDEKRTIMHVRQIETPCRYTLMGETFVGRKSAAGGKIRVRTLGGERTLAVRGHIRYFFGNAAFFDAPWHFEVIGNSGLVDLVVQPEPIALPAGSPPVTKAEMRATGALFESGRRCGEDADVAEYRWKQGMENIRADFAEVLRMADTMSEQQLAKAISAGAIKITPYSRPTSASSNNLLKQNLLATPNSLVSGYRARLQAMMDSVAPNLKSSRN